jgi:LPXTG-site transpeptidase (sortase) family protein
LEPENATLVYKGLPAELPEHPATRLVIPNLALDANVVLLDFQDGTWDVGLLTQELGHLQGTASPGSESNVVLTGNATLSPGRNGPFRNLVRLKEGHEAIVYSGEQSFTYIIESIDVVARTDVSFTYPTSHPALTLITGANWDDDLGQYTDRIVAIGRMVQP